MADALCGPSNALQNFQKHSAADRTLQQDRLVSRQSPVQGFRSNAGQNAGALDAEFEAFQAGRPGLPQPDFQRFPPQFAQPPPQHFTQAPQAPDWASDFQRMNISSPPPQLLHQQPAQAANASAAWHQDFMRQQAPVAQATPVQQTNFGSMSGFGAGGYGGQMFMQTPSLQTAPMSDVAQGKQRAQEPIPAFDEAAFEQAFAQAHQEMMEVAEAEQQHMQTTQPEPEVLDADRESEMDPLLRRIRETRPAVYSAIQVWSETGLGRTEEAVSYLDNMDRLEQRGLLVQDANEAKWIVDSLERIVARDAPQEVKTRAETLISAINQRLMSEYPLTTRSPTREEAFWQEIKEAGYMRTPPIQEQEAPKKEQKQEEPRPHSDDEMAETAGRLLEKVADNTSEKFQNSQFLELMRRLRDREVRVEEDKIVEVAGSSTTDQAAAPPSTTSYPYTQRQDSGPTQVPDVDRTILNHAATDFEQPIYSADEGNAAGLVAPSQWALGEPEIHHSMSIGVDGLGHGMSTGLDAFGASKTSAMNNPPMGDFPLLSPIPRHEQDEDAYRYHEIPKRDPITGRVLPMP